MVGRVFALGLGVILCSMASVSRAGTGVDRHGDTWLLENEQLKVELRVSDGRISVTDKRVGHSWLSAPQKALTPPQLRIPRLGRPLTIDGAPSNWGTAVNLELTHDMVAHAVQTEGPHDLSATVRLRWDAATLHLVVEVRDDKLRFAKADESQWWLWDSIEFWIDDTQCALRPDGAQVVFWCSDATVTGAQAQMKRTTKGYAVEMRLPLEKLIDKAKPGREFRFALGINDADAAGGNREGQLYFPTTWRHSWPETFAKAVLSESRTVTAVQSNPVLRDVSKLSDGRPGIRFTSDRVPEQGASLAVTFTVELASNAPEVLVEADLPDRQAKLTSFRVLPPLLGYSADAALLFALSYSNGLALPVGDLSWTRRLLRLGDLPLPWVGLVDGDRGYLIIGENPDDMNVKFDPVKLQESELLAPSIHCRDSKGAFRTARRIRYVFVDKGGMVAAAKCYRRYAKDTGLLKTLKEKMKTKPQVARLQGAPDIWGNASLAFCREAKTAGIDRAIVNAASKRKDMQEIKKLGYLISIYDDYENCAKGRKGCYGDVKIPDDCPVTAAGEAGKGWLAFDKRFQYMKRCTALQLEVAKRWIPGDLEKHPCNARFLDVTTTSDLRECHSSVHPLTRTEDRAARRALARYMGDELGLVLGGETGRWWGVDIYDYWEGMQGGGPFWGRSAGHAGKNLPQTREDIAKQYLEWGLGQRVRVPLWELCFGDCVISTSHWGESTGHIHGAAPELTAKQDAFNILYGTVPLYWVNRPFSFHWAQPELRARLLESYRNTCKLHEVVGFEEMVDFAYATPEKDVQRTRFADGTTVTVNFGAKPFDMRDGDTTYRLPQFGFFAKGPRILQYKALTDGRALTEIRLAQYLFCDGGGRRHDFGSLRSDGRVTLRQRRNGLMINIEQTKEPVLIRPARCLDKWQDKPLRLMKLNAVGDLAGEARFETKGNALIIPGDGIYRLEYAPSGTGAD
ncbi:MAG: hypothetical protein KAI66_02020 [Lentisphaeria bacterium]|nr:hypothetical protein [Lentisphaeria bacterium]